MSFLTGIQIDKAEHPRYINILCERLNGHLRSGETIDLNVSGWTPTSDSLAPMAWRGNVRHCIEGDVTRTGTQAFNPFLSVIATPLSNNGGDRQLEAGARVLIQFFPEGSTRSDEAYEAQRTIFAQIACTEAHPGQQRATDSRFVLPKLVGAARYTARKDGVKGITEFDCRVLIFNGEGLTDDTSQLLGNPLKMRALSGKPKAVEALKQFVKHLRLRGIVSGEVNAYMRFVFSKQGAVTVIVTALLDAAVEHTADKEVLDRVIARGDKMLLDIRKSPQFRPQ
ncbi:hypothetical protein FA95DRAFT_1569601 [Auriscalpium vulgare]|uniref:Uncharacterized protein n=1 Tax=Auriscalpium vulgare TaxID=40419 RepID=A0ACB8S742_9AGAM|nr:hypothetical protein FA95DRAFT_1569601 [Auriscalpium vulgare]